MSEEKIHFDKAIVPFKEYASMKGKIKEQKEEIERLNKDLDIAIDICNKRQVEIVRLNNIIDFIVESIEDMWVDGFEEDNWQYDKKVLNRKEFLDKIKELRGDKK